MAGEVEGILLDPPIHDQLVALESHPSGQGSQAF
jgi:hypothetical protein